MAATSTTRDIARNGSGWPRGSLEAATFLKNLLRGCLGDRIDLFLEKDKGKRRAKDPIRRSMCGDSRAARPMEPGADIVSSSATMVRVSALDEQSGRSERARKVLTLSGPKPGFRRAKRRGVAADARPVTRCPYRMQYGLSVEKRRLAAGDPTRARAAEMFSCSNGKRLNVPARAKRKRVEKIAMPGRRRRTRGRIGDSAWTRNLRGLHGMIDEYEQGFAEADRGPTFGDCVARGNGKRNRLADINPQPRRPTEQTFCEMASFERRRPSTTSRISKAAQELEQAPECPSPKRACNSSRLNGARSKPPRSWRYAKKVSDASRRVSEAATKAKTLYKARGECCGARSWQ